MNATTGNAAISVARLNALATEAIDMRNAAIQTQTLANNVLIQIKALAARHGVRLPDLVANLAIGEYVEFTRPFVFKGVTIAKGERGTVVQLNTAEETACNFDYFDIRLDTQHRELVGQRLTLATRRERGPAQFAKLIAQSESSRCDKKGRLEATPAASMNRCAASTCWSSITCSSSKAGEQA
jgi:hypothetical protein